MQASLIALLVSAIAAPALAGSQIGGRDRSDGCDGLADVLIGQDNDNVNNPLIQPFTPPSNQSLNNADVLEGKPL